MAFRFVERTQDWVRERQIRSRLRKLTRWLAEGRPLWVTLVGFGGAVGVAWGVEQFGAEEFLRSDQLRIAGWFLQILGVGTVAWGLKETRSIFGVPSIREQAAEWLKRFPKVFARRKGVSLSTSFSAGANASASLSVEKNRDHEPPIEERLEALEEKYEQLNQQLAEARKELKSEAQRLDEALNDERRARHDADTQIQEQLEGFSVGGLHLESMGLVWLLMGITLATLPVEMAAPWNWLSL